MDIERVMMAQLIMRDIMAIYEYYWRDDGIVERYEETKRKRKQRKLFFKTVSLVYHDRVLNSKEV